MIAADMSIRYELAVLTHGQSESLRPTLASLRENVHPLPSSIRVFADAVQDVSYVVGAVRGIFPDVEDPLVSATHPSRQAGFCRATARLWDAASRDADVDYVFWVEHDFVFERPVLLEQVAGVLDTDPWLAQVALVRNAVNENEIAAGGLVESRPGAFESRRTLVEAQGVSWVVQYLEHRAFFTTNPSLMRQEFMLENPWLDDGQPYCEGRFGIDLASRGYRFAFWGDGIPWVRHIGVRDGFGY